MPTTPKSHRPSTQPKKRESQWASRNEPWRWWYHSPAWRRLRLWVLERDAYLCQECAREGKTTCVQLGNGSAHVDHVKPHNGDWGLFIDPSNLETKCAACHSRKTASQDGGFGHAKKQ